MTKEEATKLLRGIGYAEEPTKEDEKGSLMTDIQAENRDIDVIHEFTDFATFGDAVIGATLLNLDFDISTEIRKDILPVRYWIIVIH